MGVDLGELIEPEEIGFEDLHNKELAIDAMNTLYQFLSIIRQRDGTPLKDSDGNVTSHLSGLFYRTINLMENEIRPVYVFDGEMPDLKSKESSKRRKKREEARDEWEKLKDEGKISEAYSKATQSSKLTGDMIEESKRLLDAMGVPYVEAPSEGEAQAASMVGDEVYAVGSQDWDCMLFGADRMVRNLTSRKTRKSSGGGTKKISVERIELENVLDELEVSHRQLVWMGILMGTDFNPDGVHGIGPKTALKIVREHDSLEDILEEDKVKDTEFENDPELIEEFFLNPPVEETSYEFGEPDKDEIRKVLVEDHGFSEKRVNSGLKKLETALESRQPGLDSFV
ncbi:flap endonuclease-1 [Candidatus Nanohalococcus occultus]|uniref:Flap endonuclease 1 n=1 Tax=Candidatus Nanohalococcus occultus TaxID=2978047 RepID=A0ABY8CL08_9ARCH|nr:5'-3' exonuclease [Candidatus Nanohaloarchaeota archaeon SVXNc]